MGQIEDYMHGEGTLAIEVLDRRIKSSIEACQSRIDALRKGMQGQWKIELVKGLRVPFTIMEEMAMNLMDKPTVLTITQRLE